MSDFPHFDHPADYLNMLGTLVAPLSETARRNLLGEDCARLYKIHPRRAATRFAREIRSERDLVTELRAGRFTAADLRPSTRT